VPFAVGRLDDQRILEIDLAGAGGFGCVSVASVDDENS
jgi:hypothetical protein